jgi:hypothetical protein
LTVLPLDLVCSCVAFLPAFSTFTTFFIRFLFRLSWLGETGAFFFSTGNSILPKTTGPVNFLIAALIGAGGLGLTVYVALGRLDIGSAVIGGTGIVILAIILDRITQKLVKSN